MQRAGVSGLPAEPAISGLEIRVMFMKTRYKIISLSIIFGLCVWIVDAVLGLSIFQMPASINS